MLDVVDMQIHMLRDDTPEELLAAMDALGIRSAMVDEWWVAGHAGGGWMPAIALPGTDVYRLVGPGADRAALKYPDRFTTLLRVDARDPEALAIIRLSGQSPTVRGIRFDIRHPETVRNYEEGRFNAMFEACKAARLPAFLTTFNRPHAVERYLRDFPDQQFVYDHCGQTSSSQGWDDILRLGASYGNIWLKWSHPQLMFGYGPFPASQLRAPLRKAISAFGADRIAWGSDFTMVTSGETWGETLFALRDSGCDLSDDERAWILGRSARKLLGWDVPPVDNSAREAQNRAADAAFRAG